MAGIYIHIPFCASRCIYCGFYSTIGRRGLQERYIKALIKEYDMRRDYLGNKTIDTIYIGGGTPSLLSTENIKELTDSIGTCNNEFTMECNPDDITDELASTIERTNINRISMGVQTFSDKRLNFLHRRHSASQVPEAIKRLRSVGINNISIDLMFGFPGETLEEWQSDLSHAIEQNVEHISAYSLMYEEGTPLFRMMQEGKIKENDEETSAQMYEMLIDMLTHAGYEHYEISNFSKKGFHSRHNSSYWNGTHYIGLGAAAHSYDGKSRQWNVSDVEQYIYNIENGVIPMEIEYLDEVTKYNDLITTALRTRDGINLDTLSDEQRAYITRYAHKSIDAGLLCITDNNIHLTRKGLYVSDDVMADLIMV